MWLTWGISIVIGAFWFTKMVVLGEFKIQRTPLDIPIALFLVSQVISTIFSWDTHVSLWGYYSRFNGGLLSIISYIFLYYAFVSNFSSESDNENSFVTFIKKHTNISPSIVKIILFVIGSIFYLVGYYLYVLITTIPTPPPSYKEIDLREVYAFLGSFSLILCIFLAMFSFIWTTSGNMVKRSLLISIISGTIVALWGLPSHFGYDPTCAIFRFNPDIPFFKNFNVECWTADFQPRGRIFSTLGQPAWLAAYLAILIPIAVVLFKNSFSKKKLLLAGCFLILIILFYVDLIFTATRAGVLGLWISLIFLFLAYIWLRRKNIKSIINLPLSILLCIFLIITFVMGTPIPQLANFTLPVLKTQFAKTQVADTPEKPIDHEQSQPNQDQNQTKPPQTQTSAGGTESGDIRRLVWQGGLEAWKNHPLIGTGVETFAFAYYKYKPIGQNSVSEWNFLYNKAHNEYLNYLATTGVFGLGSYLSMIGYFIFRGLSFIMLIRLSLIQHLNQMGSRNKFGMTENNLLILVLIAGYFSILITNFFGFSVVIINIYFFLIPAFVLILGGMISQNKTNPLKVNYTMSVWQWTPIFLISIVSLYMLITLFSFWRGDLAYAKGYNSSRAGEYQAAYEYLYKAVALRENEPVFKDELSINSAILAVALLSDPAKKEDPETISTATNLAKEAITTSNQLVSENPNNVVFWKSRVRLFFTLSQVDGRFLSIALEAIERASALAPNDANILYNLGVLYGQNNKIAKGIEVLKKTVIYKPDYRDAHYALGLFYHEAAIDKDGKVIDQALQEKAVAQMRYILTNISTTDSSAQESLKTWEKQ